VFTYDGWQVTLCVAIWHVMLRSSGMGFPLRAVNTTFYCSIGSWCSYFESPGSTRMLILKPQNDNNNNFKNFEHF